jgi:hypothetical protein
MLDAAPAMTEAPLPGDLPGPPLDPATLAAIVEAGIARYFAERRALVRPFVDRHFSLRGALRLHRRALGWDLLRAPANLTLALPQLALSLGAAAARRLRARQLAGRLDRHLLLRTAVAREIAWLVQTELLELPCRDGARESRRDALAAAILADPRLEARLRPQLAALGPRGADPEFRRRLDAAMATYTGSRTAAAEITTTLLSLGSGLALLKQVTPGAVALGASLAGIMAQQAAISAFPLGSWLGGWWYGLFPASASAGLLAGTTGGALLAAAALAAFAGILADPVQRRLGLHERRLNRLLDSLQRQMADPAAAPFALRAQYVARLSDLLDLVAAAYRLTRL